MDKTLDNTATPVATQNDDNCYRCDEKPRFTPADIRWPDGHVSFFSRSDYCEECLDIVTDEMTEVDPY